MGRELKRSSAGARDAFTKGGGCHFRSLCGRREAGTNWNKSEELPKILFLVSPQDLTLVVNEVSNIMQLILPRLCILLGFNYRPRHNADIKLFGQLLIFVQIIVP